MAEPNSAYTYNDLISRVSIYLGYGSAPTGDKLIEVDMAVQDGYQQFLQPPVINGNAHLWSFLSPLSTLQIVAGVDTYALPDDFASIKKGISFPSTSRQDNTVERVGESQVRAFNAKYDYTGDPRVCAVRPVAGNGTSGQRYEIVFAPMPDANLVISYAYNRRLNKLSNTNLYPIGGSEYGQVLVSSCLAIAESRTNDDEGPRTAEFFRSLESAIMRDQSAACPDTLGYNGDSSVYPADIDYRDYVVTVDGVTP